MLALRRRLRSFLQEHGRVPKVQKLAVSNRQRSKKNQTVIDMDNIFKHDILSEVLVRPIQLVSMRFSLYCQNVIGKKASFLLHRLPGRDAGPGGFKALKKKNRVPVELVNGWVFPKQAHGFFLLKMMIFHSKGVKWRHPPFKRKRLFFFYSTGKKHTKRLLGVAQLIKLLLSRKIIVVPF